LPGVERAGPWVPRALTIAGSDSGGGAGIQADLKTFAALGVWGTSAVTSVTVQNTQGVGGVADVPSDMVAEQIRAVTGDIGIDAAKTGMLSSAAIAEAVAGAVEAAGIQNLVVDPVFVSKHGHPLLAQEAVEVLRRRIVPLAAVVTPNLPEAGGLTGMDVAGAAEMVKAAEQILEMGAGAVLVKGGHLGGDRADDYFTDGTREEWLESGRIETADTHGTGCVLSAAITARLALGNDLLDAVRAGKTFVTGAIRHALRIGGGIGPVDPGWEAAALSRRGRRAPP